MFSFFKKKQPFEKFLEPFNSICELLFTLSKDDDGNDKKYNPVDLATTAGAIIGAAYLSNRTTILLGNFSKENSAPLMVEIISLFRFISASSIKQIEQNLEYKIDIKSENIKNFADKLIDDQYEKMGRYLEALGKYFANGRNSIGADLVREVQMDVYGEVTPDMIFSMSLIDLISKVV